MKKIIIILAIGLLSCNKQEVTPKDCNCDKIIDVVKPSIIGQQTQIVGKVITLNECTGVQTTFPYTAKGNEVPKVGLCRTSSMY